MAENNATNTNEILDEWIHNFVTDKNETYINYSIDDESKEILLHLKSSNSSSIRIEYDGNSGTRPCGCCDGYFEEYYHIFLADTKLPYYEVTIFRTEDDVDLTITHSKSLFKTE